MKILKLRFKNLNSLAGEWNIDFTSPEYNADGIFAITGPTGAGKSTIMDAICLALYGRTPRLDSISASTNEIMSRQAGECFAEVVFETDEGRYKAHWSQRRAKNKSDGALQQPKHEISDEISERILASQILRTEKEILAKTGMDFKRFTQSMMLAQGGFAAFLQATANERAPILEQITGTEIYSDISRHVFERQKAENQKVEILKVENARISIMDPADEQQAQNEIIEKNITKSELTESIERNRVIDLWFKKITELTLSSESITEEETILTREIAAFEPTQLVLRNAIRALPLDSDYATLLTLRSQQVEDLSTIKELQQQSPELKEAVEHALSAFSEAEKQNQISNQEREELLQLTAKLRPLDERILQLNESIEKLSTEVIRITKEKRGEEETAKLSQDKINEYSDKLEKIEKFKTENLSDASLVEELTGIISSLHTLNQNRIAYESSRSNLKALETDLLKKNGVLELIAKRIKEASFANNSDMELVAFQKMEISQLLNGKTIEEVTRAKDVLLLRVAELKKIQDLDEERNRLVDEKPCPLCGSTHHPWAQGNIPQLLEEEKDLAKIIDQITNYQKLKNSLDTQTEKEKESAKILSDNKQKLELEEQQQQNIHQQIQVKMADTLKMKSAFDKAGEAIKNILKPYRISETPSDEDTINNLTQSLTKRKQNWIANNNKKIEYEGLMQSEISKISQAEGIINSKQKDLLVKMKEEDVTRTSLCENRKERYSLFGDKVVLEEEQLMVKRTLSHKELLDKISIELNEKKLLLNNNTSLIGNLQEASTKRKEKIDVCESNFLIQLQTGNFADEQEYISCRISNDLKELLERSAHELQTKKTQIETRKAELTNALGSEKARNLSEDNPELIKEKLQTELEALSTITAEIAVTGERLQQNEASKALGTLGLENIRTQAQICERWDKLNKLIGSSDGKKFRNFAQGLTLEIMISYANHQLTRLSDRYLLSRDTDEPLELKVIDNYQAGQIRSTKNLSGGESFLVSLSLALGLSGMSSRNIRVDSLFLDEGFGTLDEETLETALSTLASLRQEGKMIGVISHVGAMKERINTKITVEPIREGKSIISGPGCKRISEN